MRCFYSQNLELGLPAGHPFQVEKFRVSKDMLLEGGVLRAEEIVEVGLADSHLLMRVHDTSYLERIYRGQLDMKEQIRLGLPATPMLYQRSVTEVEATRLACHAALEEGVAVALAGGSHHAFRDHGEGFSVFNDVAIAVADLQAKRPGIRIMIVDTDAQAGNGTASLLRDDPRVFTYSIHVGPGRRETLSAGSMDVETVRYVEGTMYLRQLFSSLAAALDTFAPDLVIWVAGADNHSDDRFGQMYLTLEDMKRRDEVLLGALIRNRIPVAVLYGEGTNRESLFTAQLHRNTVETAKRLSDALRGH
ncbi:acetoin utilization deacetylase AcuC-like enzyme [Haloferula luteola]|uniref:Acetoin utilization deacetylase AcuC-like enzyme n=1 Tax=Haloferula luteola TaxID=595692 RepID=A0A840UYD9_9BACT|nr:histone deacetylase [Haloferula luteola]MBB5350003.1 acetoin utilization deacetylase AcuC-like enzyme [Haloferula luteola]